MRGIVWSSEPRAHEVRVMILKTTSRHPCGCPGWTPPAFIFPQAKIFCVLMRGASLWANSSDHRLAMHSLMSLWALSP